LIRKSTPLGLGIFGFFIVSHLSYVIDTLLIYFYFLVFHALYFTINIFHSTSDRCRDVEVSINV